MNFSSYRFFHPARKTPLVAIVAVSLMYYLVWIAGLIVFPIAFFIVLWRDRDWGLWWVLPVILLGTLLLLAILQWGPAEWRRRKVIPECFVAFTPEHFVHQEYDDERKEVLRTTIPLKNLREFEYVRTPGGAEWPDTHEVVVHYVDDTGQPATLTLSFFDYETTGPLDEVLTQEWQALQGA